MQNCDICASYEYYVGKGGEMDKAAYTIAARRATMEIDNQTRMRTRCEQPEWIRERIKQACCRLADIYHAQTNTDNGGVTSEKVGSYAVTYAAGSERQRADTSEVRKAIYDCLAVTGLLYCGV